MKSSSRPLGLFDAICIGVNTIIGSGIFFFPGKLAALLGPSSVLAFFIIGVLLVAVSLCFSEAGSYFEEPGGAYLYSERAFGSTIGFGVGWLCWVNQIFSWAAVASAISTYLSYFNADLVNSFPTRVIAISVIIFMGGINYFGVKLGANASNVFTIAKLLPLLALLVVGLPQLNFTNFSPFAPHGFNSFGAASLMTFFAFQGFENIPAPAGEINRAKKTVPLAVIFSLALTLVIYSLIQTVAVGIHSGVAGSSRPLAEVAEILFGPIGGTLIAIGAIISMLGYNSSTALTSPRYLVALARDRHLPKQLEQHHWKYDTPFIAILTTTIISVTLALLLDFKKLVDITNVAVALFYSATCLSVLKLRKIHNVVNKNPVIPIVGVIVSLWLGWQAAFNEMLWCLAFLTGGYVIKIVNNLRPSD